MKTSNCQTGNERSLYLVHCRFAGIFNRQTGDDIQLIHMYTV